MSFANKRISSLGTSHDPSAYMADSLKVEHTDTKYIVRNNKGSEIQKHLLKWRESGHLWKITGQSSLQIVPFFVARFSACFAYMEAPGGKSGNY